MRIITNIFIHCSDSPDNVLVTAKDIKKWHTDDPPLGNGWPDIGYHWVVLRDGTKEPGRPMKTPGAHVKGHNKYSIGICWVGRDEPTKLQYRALIKLVCELLVDFDLEVEDVLGHYEKDSDKTCPNLDMDQVRQDIKQALHPPSPWSGILDLFLGYIRNKDT